MPDADITYAWRGAFANPELNSLHAEGFDHAVIDADDWWGQVNRHSLGWVVAREGDGLRLCPHEIAVGIGEAHHKERAREQPEQPPDHGQAPVVTAGIGTSRPALVETPTAVS